MWLIKGAFVGKKNFDVIKMQGKTIKKSLNIFWSKFLLPSSR
jgi:hypothetical protein